MITALFALPSLVNAVASTVPHETESWTGVVTMLAYLAPALVCVVNGSVLVVGQGVSRFELKFKPICWFEPTIYSPPPIPKYGFHLYCQPLHLLS